jgi:hypothetical protein
VAAAGVPGVLARPHVLLPTKTQGVVLLAGGSTAMEATSRRQYGDGSH